MFIVGKFGARGQMRGRHRFTLMSSTCLGVVAPPEYMMIDGRGTGRGRHRNTDLVNHPKLVARHRNTWAEMKQCATALHGEAGIRYLLRLLRRFVGAER